MVLFDAASVRPVLEGVQGIVLRPVAAIGIALMVDIHQSPLSARALESQKMER